MSNKSKIIYTIIILPSTYLGNLEYFSLLLGSERALIDIHEKYQKQTFRNRCVILTSNGAQNLSIPVYRPSGKNTLVKDVQISNAENWRKDHLKAIESAYRNTPYYEHYIDQLLTIYQKDHTLLHQINAELTSFLIQKIGLSTQIQYSESTIELSDLDYRKSLSPKNKSNFKTHSYIQTFQERHGFINNPSTLDLLFNEGPNSITILSESNLL